MGRFHRSVLRVVAAATLIACSATASQAADPQVVRVLVAKVTWGPEPQASVADLTAPAVSFYAKASFGTVRLVFTETPWLHGYADESICNDRPALVDQGQAAAASYSPESYDHAIYVTPCRYVDFGSDAYHRGTVGLPTTPSLFEHELGHTFGISHAAGLDCQTKCLLDPYANPIDTMSNGPGDFGALQKAEAGWPIKVRMVTIPGTYRLAALEEPSALSQALIVRHGTTEIWIDHREPIGNDVWLKTSVWRRVTSVVLLHETPVEPLSIPFNRRRPDTLMGNGGPRGLWLMHGKTITVPHLMRLTVLRHRGTTVTVRLTKLR